ncbi:hypothetical protein [Fretibacter rubidus]|uniref:hypothetical protein n=1 Tax=Fretibacter rubidus TaxID=570162 RepID=UPI00352A2D10
MSRAHKHRPIVANDNDPTHIRPRGDAVGFNHMLRERQTLRRDFETRHDKPLDLKVPLSGRGDWGTKLGSVCLLASIVAVLFALITPQAAGTRLIALAALAWTGLWMTYLSTNIGRPRFAALSTLLATLGGLGIWVVASTQLGLPLSAPDGAAVFAATMAVIALCLRSPMALLISTCAGFMWLVGFTQIDSINVVPLWGLPILAVVQMIIAARYKSGLSAMMALLSAYGWLGFMMMSLHETGDLSALHIAGIAALTGFANYRFGKAAGDSDMPFAALHVGVGWTAALIGGLALQHYWSGAQHPLWTDPRVRPAGLFGWTIACYSLLGLIVVGTAMRWFGGRGSAIGTLAVCAVAAAIIPLSGHTDMLDPIMQSRLGLPAIPTLSFVIAGIITASAIAMTVNGARRRIWALTLIGLAALGAQLFLLSDTQIWNMDTMVVYGLSTVVSLCFAALLASESTHPARAQPYQYAPQYRHG